MPVFSAEAGRPWFDAPLVLSTRFPPRLQNLAGKNSHIKKLHRLLAAYQKSVVKNMSVAPLANPSPRLNTSFLSALISILIAFIFGPPAVSRLLGLTFPASPW
ncbi:MAG: hypothetical protein HQK59_14195, partial [Deltaproteobacteria bacterium]|nr:hypothetical protein [Deltaproteobacteria bacterium]